jgi:hypothetical protein
MRPYKYYKHEKMRDVILKPIRIFFVPEKQIYKVKGYWYNCHFHEISGSKPFRITETTDKLELTLAQMREFKEYDYV